MAVRQRVRSAVRGEKEDHGGDDRANYHRASETGHGRTAIRRFRSKPHLALCLSVAALTVAGPARADDPPSPEEVSAADAYRESVPTAGGAKPTGTSREKTRLAPAVSARLGRDTTSTLLREVATSSAYGAPQRPLRRPRALGPGPATSDDKVVPSARLPALDAASGALGDAVGRVRLALLLVVLAGILVGAVGARLATARDGTRQPSLPA